MSTITLTGYLGKNREIRDTRERSYTARSWNEVAEMHEEYEATSPSREFARLSLATHRRSGDGWATAWHNLVVWDLHRQDVSAVRIARKGDQVRVTGREETFRFRTAEGEEKEIRQIVVDRFEIVRMKAATEIP